jgi:very-short-patch-repair endonuclease
MGEENIIYSCRTKFLESKGYRILRFWNNEVMKEIDTVINAMEQALREIES